MLQKSWEYIMRHTQLLIFVTWKFLFFSWHFEKAEGSPAPTTKGGPGTGWPGATPCPHRPVRPRRHSPVLPFPPGTP